MKWCDVLLWDRMRMRRGTTSMYAVYIEHSFCRKVRSSLLCCDTVSYDFSIERYRPELRNTLSYMWMNRVVLLVLLWVHYEQKDWYRNENSNRFDGILRWFPIFSESDESKLIHRLAISHNFALFLQLSRQQFVFVPNPIGFSLRLPSEKSVLCLCDTCRFV